MFPQLNLFARMESNIVVRFNRTRDVKFCKKYLVVKITAQGYVAQRDRKKGQRCRIDNKIKLPFI